MSELTKRILVSLWLLLSLPFNVAVLKQLIRSAFDLFAGLHAGLDRWMAAQYLLALVFVLWVIVFLLWGARLGRTLAVVLLAGSCCAVAGQLLFELVFTLQGHPRFPLLMGWVAIGVILLLNVLSIRALTASKMLVRPAQTLN